MPANASIYIQEPAVDLKQVFQSVKSDKSSFKKATYYDVTLGGDVVRYNIMPTAEVAGHIQGLLGYISTLDHDDERKNEISYAISHTQIVLGLVTDKEFEDNHAIWSSLFQIADKYNGFVFVYDSILLPNGAAIVGPMVEQS